MKKISKKRLKRECDRLLREYILLRDQGRCQYCGKRGNQPHHIFTKGAYPSLRYDLRNVILLCVYCHRSFAHGKPLEFWEWLQKTKGWNYCDELRTMAYFRKKGKIDYELEKIYLQDMIQKFKDFKGR